MIIKGDSRYIPLRDESVNCIITSPPYWSLGKYDIPDLIWDGDEGCDHNFKEYVRPDGGGYPTESAQVRNTKNDLQRVYGYKAGFCGRCGAWRGQLGLEPTIDLYLKHLLQIMDECWRVLREDGTCWINMGDSYFGDSPVRKSAKEQFDPECQTVLKRSAGGHRRSAASIDGLRAKSLCLIPYRFAIEMVDRGWILRNIIIWHKPNCMPSSVKDRFTVDFEPVFFFVKSRKYWFEQQYDEQSKTSHPRFAQGITEPPPSKENSKEANRPGYKDWRKYTPVHKLPQGRNRRCVWTISTQPYPESHFATFPEALIEPMIRAGCPKGGIVLDPFCGSGTTMRVAESLQKEAIGIDLGYENLSEKRTGWNQVELL
jgi:site-specific DNA-methyltransferase (adenine-specific)